MQKKKKRGKRCRRRTSSSRKRKSKSCDCSLFLLKTCIRFNAAHGMFQCFTQHPSPISTPLVTEYVLTITCLRNQHCTIPNTLKQFLISNISLFLFLSPHSLPPLINHYHLFLDYLSQKSPLFPLSHSSNPAHHQTKAFPRS